MNLIVHTQREGHKPTNHSLGHSYLPEEAESNNLFIINLIPQLTKDFLALPNTLYYTYRQWPVYSNYKNTMKQPILYATQNKCEDVLC